MILAKLTIYSQEEVRERGFCWVNRVLFAVLN